MLRRVECSCVCCWLSPLRLSRTSRIRYSPPHPLANCRAAFWSISAPDVADRLVHLFLYVGQVLIRHQHLEGLEILRIRVVHRLAGNPALSAFLLCRLLRQVRRDHHLEPVVPRLVVPRSNRRKLVVRQLRRPLHHGLNQRQDPLRSAPPAHLVVRPHVVRPPRAQRHNHNLDVRPHYAAHVVHRSQRRVVAAHASVDAGQLAVSLRQTPSTRAPLHHVAEPSRREERRRGRGRPCNVAKAVVAPVASAVDAGVEGREEDGPPRVLRFNRRDVHGDHCVRNRQLLPPALRVLTDDLLESLFVVLRLRHHGRHGADHAAHRRRYAPGHRLRAAQKAARDVADRGGAAAAGGVAAGGARPGGGRRSGRGGRVCGREDLLATQLVEVDEVFAGGCARGLGGAGPVWKCRQQREDAARAGARNEVEHVGHTAPARLLQAADDEGGNEPSDAAAVNAQDVDLTLAAPLVDLARVRLRKEGAFVRHGVRWGVRRGRWGARVKEDASSAEATSCVISVWCPSSLWCSNEVQIL
eukprot:Rhum_TRINITY_DN1011_c0_g1::Rhum_TRINITY_DN1011_c0_g1_i1::g.3061::m.3061